MRESYSKLPSGVSTDWRRLIFHENLYSYVIEIYCFSITGFGLQLFFAFIFYSCNFSLSIAIIRVRKKVFPEVKKPTLAEMVIVGKGLRAVLKPALWWLRVLFHNMGCRLYFFLYFCTATKLGRSSQLLPVHSFSSWLSLVRYPSLEPSYLFHLNLLFDGAPAYQRLLTRSNSLLWASLPKEWHTSLWQQVRGLQIVIWRKKKHIWKQIWKKK